jgi:crotonobetainyl-CoA:carnitine CoA-transferase CaiB-like acyl-CoA transferase
MAFDLHDQLAGLLAASGMSAELTGGSITFEGEDPIVDSRLRLGAVAAVTRMAPSVAAAAIWRERTGSAQDLTCDLRKVIHELNPNFHDPMHVTLGGHSSRVLESDTLASNGYNGFAIPTRDGRHITLSNVYRGLRDAMADVIGHSPHRIADIREAIATEWDARDLEDAAAEKGAAAGMVRTEEEWAAEEHARALSQLPVVSIERIGDSEPEPLAHADRPLSAVRVLAMARVGAGGVIGQTLAEHGADVLNLWDVSRTELIEAHLTAHMGMRSARIDEHSAAGRERVTQLLTGSDMFISNRRPGVIERSGLSFEECAAIRPGIIHVSLRAYGHTGPWADRPGFDPQVLSVTGPAVVDGGLGQPTRTPVGVINDWAAGWLAAYGGMVALLRRSQEGGSYRVRVSLARTSMWWMGWDRVTSAAALDEEPHRIMTPDTFILATPLGEFKGVSCQVRFSATQPFFDQPLTPIGSSAPIWIDR